MRGLRRTLTCAYCQRTLTSPHTRASTSATRDHVMPRSVGGTRKVPCCLKCNQLKGDIHPSVWRWFTENHPGWWRAFATSLEVEMVCRVQFGGRVRTAIVGRAPRRDFEPATSFDRVSGDDEFSPSAVHGAG